MGLKEVRDFPEDIQCILAEPEPESQLPAFQEPLPTASWGEYLVGLTYAELTTAMPKSGGEQNFSYALFSCYK